MNPDRIKIFTGSANPALAEEICQQLGLDLGMMKLKRFSDGEINLQILEGNESVAAFYAALGFSVEKRVNMGKRIPQNVPVD